MVCFAVVCHGGCFLAFIVPLPSGHAATAARTLCIYAYYEKDGTYRKNLLNFLNSGLNGSSDFVFVINGDACSVAFPNAANITVIRRSNSGYDFGAWRHALKLLGSKVSLPLPAVYPSSWHQIRMQT